MRWTRTADLESEYLIMRPRERAEGYVRERNFERERKEREGSGQVENEKQRKERQRKSDVP